MPKCRTAPAPHAARSSQSHPLSRPHPRLRRLAPCGASARLPTHRHGSQRPARGSVLRGDGRRAKLGGRHRGCAGEETLLRHLRRHCNLHHTQTRASHVRHPSPRRGVGSGCPPRARGAGDGEGSPSPCDGLADTHKLLRTTHLDDAGRSHHMSQLDLQSARGAPPIYIPMFKTSTQTSPIKACQGRRLLAAGLTPDGLPTSSLLSTPASPPKPPASTGRVHVSTSTLPRRAVRVSPTHKLAQHRRRRGGISGVVSSGPAGRPADHPFPAGVADAPHAAGVDNVPQQALQVRGIPRAWGSFHGFRVTALVGLRTNHNNAWEPDRQVNRLGAPEGAARTIGHRPGATASHRGQGNHRARA